MISYFTWLMLILNNGSVHVKMRIKESIIFILMAPFLINGMIIQVHSLGIAWCNKRHSRSVQIVAYSNLFVHLKIFSSTTYHIIGSGVIGKNLNVHYNLLIVNS